MIRKTIVPRADWQDKVEKLGLMWHTNRGKYWTDEAYYSFTMEEVLKIEKATNELHEMCIAAAGHVIENKLYDKLHIPSFAIPMIEESWEKETPSLYGRFDFVYNGIGEPKMLEYNADTPTSLIESALVQWFWMQEQFPAADQFNSLHEKLIDAWKEFKEGGYLRGDVLHLTSIDDVEDAMTVSYIRETAEQAGITTKYLTIDKIGITEDGRFVDEENEIIHSIFKLYPWEWMVSEDYGKQIVELGTGCQWIEPGWKMILSNKGILPILNELFPDSPYLLRSSFEQIDTVMWESYVKKPILSREGAGVTVTMFDQELAHTDNNGYGEEGYVYQELAVVPNFDGNHTIIGSWIIGQEAAGMGVRESDSLVTDNLSRYVPHIIEG